MVTDAPPHRRGCIHMAISTERWAGAKAAQHSGPIPDPVVATNGGHDQTVSRRVEGPPEQAGESAVPFWHAIRLILG